ncbi:M1 family metallopeptidase [Paenibacillus sp. Marseille-Q4541]|uniref:M1 family metallopeptidase n=1 Tax=Paenibacillus sp. Marseille-Q4541 TaxID=2831522 RepID=UPI001BACCD13|nr:M1 family metallopeptidase [Paenibacillus sp. Marseille-Q4541]
MTPVRAKIYLSSVLAICVLGGTLLLSLSQAPSTQSTLAPITGNMNAPVPAPIQESVQTPLAEVLSDRVVEYHIDVQLTEDHVLKGTSTMTWTHPGEKTVSELYFHLYPNAFASDETTFMKESGGKLRGDAMPKDGYGSMKLTEIKTTDGLSLLHRIQYVQPDDGNVNDKSLVKVRLPKPVKGGESITLSMAFEVDMPKIFARMGTADNFVMAGQWFPKLSVYEPVGTRNRKTEGWNLHQYHGNSEFYSDFGIYSVRIAVPDNYTVAATGFPTKPYFKQNGQRIYQFYADDVHDFAWAASPDFVVVEEPFSAPNVPGVRIKLYLDPAHADLKDRYLYAAKSALSNFSKWYGKYPYSTLSIVVPPKAGNGAGGMEYPTLITAFGADETSPGYELERTVIHEIGHQYFYGMIASNEFEEAWLDEAFTSYAEDRLMEQEYGLTPNIALQSGYISSPASLTQEAWKYDSQQEYAENVYTRGKLILRAIEQQIGTKKMDKVMATYASKYRFKHPSTKDFQTVVEQVTRKSWATFFDQYVYSNMMADFAVDSISIQDKSTEKEPSFISTVKVTKKAGDYTEIPVIFAFKDGHLIRKVWNGENAEIIYNLTYKEPLDWVMVDPSYSIAIENKHINNYMRAEVDEKVQTRFNISITKLIEALLGSLSW